MAVGNQKYVVVVNSAKEKCYNILREQILNLELKPGTLISTQNVADELSISRTPVREAFLKLQEEHLLEISHQKPSMVSRIDLHRVHQEFFVRKTLEIENMRNFVSNPSKIMVLKMQQNVEEQKEALENQNYAMYQKLDNEFHEIPFMATGQGLAASLIFRMNGHYYRSRMLVRKSREVSNDIIGEHEKLLECIMQKDVERTVKLLQEHIYAIQPLQEVLLKQWPEYFVQNC